MVLIFGTTVVAEVPAANVTANGASASVQTKVGVLDWQLLLAKAPQAEEAGKRLEKEFQARKDAFIAKQKDFQTKQEKLGRDKDVMAEVERKKVENDLTKAQQDLRRLDEELRSDYTARHREEMDDFLKVTREVVDTLAKDKKYDLVLPQDATIYVADRVDITEEVLESLKKLKQQSKADTKSKK